MRAKYADPRVDYTSPLWTKVLRPNQLAREKCCAYCYQMGRVVKATHVDHKIPHRGDFKLFSDPKNLQSLCATHANSTKQKEELTGQAQGCSLTGWPTDKNHFWNGGPRAPPRKKTNQQAIGKLKRRRK